VIGFNVVY